MTARTGAIIVLALFLMWSVVSWYWYTCGVRGFCFEFNVPNVMLVSVSHTGLPFIESNYIDVEKVCAHAYITELIGVNYRNSFFEVKKLEHFLNVTQGEDLAEDGLFGISDIRALQRFQWKYRDLILFPNNLIYPSGHIDNATLAHINAIACNARLVD